MGNEVLVAVPLFVFMGVMLEHSRVAEELLKLMTMGRCFGALLGGLAWAGHVARAVREPRCPERLAGGSQGDRQRLRAGGQHGDPERVQGPLGPGARAVREPARRSGAPAQQRPAAADRADHRRGHLRVHPAERAEQEGVRKLEQVPWRAEGLQHDGRARFPASPQSRFQVADIGRAAGEKGGHPFSSFSPQSAKTSSVCAPNSGGGR
ncbi:MAG: TRAP transporter large permease subunit [bacterium]|nr:TRAP transporter large permease subunit [bacterium]